MKKSILTWSLFFWAIYSSDIHANEPFLRVSQINSGSFFVGLHREKTPTPTDTLPVRGSGLIKSDSPRLKRLQLGIAIGPDLVAISVQNKMDSLSTSKKVQAHSTLGFHGGLAFRLNFKRWFYLNAQPQLNFQGANLSYDQQGVRVKTSIAPLTLEIPVHFVFKTTNYKLNPAFFIGGRYIGDISESNLNNPINIKKGETALEAGVGVEIKFFKRFVFIPSIGAVIGTGNLLQDGLGSIGTAIENVKRTKLELHFVFF